jgi:DNA-binding CsgD family transcriptional regulator
VAVAEYADVDLVGRDGELAQIRSILARRAAGRPAIVVVLSGEAGIGKSRLARAVMSAESAAGSAVFEGTCLNLDARVPFAPVLEALRPLLLASDGTVNSDQFGYPGQVAASLYAHIPSPEMTVSAGQPLSCLREVISSGAAHTPSLLVLEDMQWADRSTLDLVRLLGQARANLALLLTYRANFAEQSGALLDLVDDLRRTAEVADLRLGVLSQDDVQILAKLRGAELDMSDAAALVARSGGNPLFALALLDAGDPSGLPRHLAALLRAEVDALGSEAREVLGAASVGGSRLDTEVLLEVVGKEKAVVEACLREAVTKGVLLRGRHLQFRHDLIREAVYDDLLPTERIRLHEGFAQAELGMHRATARSALSVLSKVAHHWEAAGRAPEALDASCRAGMLAWRQGAAAEALQHLRRALVLWDEVDNPEEVTDQALVDLLRIAGGAAGAVGDHAQAVELIERALREADPDADPYAAARTYAARGSMAAGFNDGIGAPQWVERALEVAPPGPSLERATSLAVLAEHRANMGLAREALSLATEAADMAATLRGRVSPDRQQELGSTHADALRVRGRAMAWLGMDVEMLAAIREAIGVAERTAGRSHALFAQLDLAYALRSLGRDREATELLTKLDAAASDAGLPGLGHMIAEAKLGLLTDNGPADAAQALLDELRAAGMADWRAAWYQASIFAMTGRYAEAAAETQAWVEIEVRSGTTLFAVGVVAEHVESLRRCGRVADAIAEARQLAREALSVDADYHRAVAARVSIPAALADERGSAEAEELMTAAVQLLRDLERDSAAGLVGDAAAAQLALAQAWLAEPDDESAWRRAADAVAGVGGEVLVLSTRVRLAKALLARGDRDGARQLVTETWMKARAIGANGVARDLHDLAGPLRLRLENVPATAGVLSRLTAREREVLDLLADGASNRRIAAGLFISEKTASVHVSRILAKLGVSTRLEAAAIHHRQAASRDNETG